MSVDGGLWALPCSPVEISISCRNLLDKDVFSKSDPMCVCYVIPFGSKQWKEHQRTEVIKNCLNPDFMTKLVLPYHFEENQKLKFELYDIDSASGRLSDHDFLGQMTCTLAQIVANGTVEKSLQSQDNKDIQGKIILTAEELAANKEEVALQFAAKKLDKKDFFGKSDPFLVFYKSNESGHWIVTHRTEYHKNTLNPTWNVFTIASRTFCNCDYDRNIKVECYDWNNNGSHSIIGEFYVTLRGLLKGPGAENTYPVINPEKKNKKSYNNSGEVMLVSVKVDQRPTFIDYIRGGTDLQCTIAIDFTASNGNPQTPQSLHYIGSNNPYQRALTAVGEIIRDYDSDKLFPVLGFGARLPPDGRVSHEFFVNGDTQNPYCKDVAGVVEAYRSCIARVSLYGPTNFAPVINHVARFAHAHKTGSHYFILLIITDGIITDMPQTKEAIVSASTLPLSIIIVGVGNADFEGMEELDGDTVRLSSRGREAARDIVQFVPFNNFEQHGDGVAAKLMLAKEVLQEIPDQFLSYMKVNNIKPNPARSDIIQLPPDPHNI